MRRARASVYERGCACGQVRLRVGVPSRRAGTRVVCYCRDCQTAARALGAEATLTAAGGTDIWQTTPDLLDIVAGAEHLRILRLSPTGLFRWHAGCCGTPLFNTLPRLGLPFVGVQIADHDGASAALGPVRAHVFAAMARAGAGAPAKDVNVNGAGWGVVSRMASACLTGRAGKNPLRAAGGGPIAEVRILTEAEREAARPGPR